MELHVHLSACHQHAVRVEHVDWSEPLFNERLGIREGKVPTRPGSGSARRQRSGVWGQDPSGSTAEPWPPRTSSSSTHSRLDNPLVSCATLSPASRRRTTASIEADNVNAPIR